MRLYIVVVSGLVMSLVLCSTLIHPFGPVKQQNSGRPLLAGVFMSADVRNIISTSCRNCHSEMTEWPWYSYLAPVSWLIESDVSRARTHVNFSHWEEYSREQRFSFLDEIGEMVSSQSMPPSRYLLLHPEAKLSDADVEVLTHWARTESKGLRSALRQAPARPAFDRSNRYATLP